MTLRIVVLEIRGGRRMSLILQVIYSECNFNALRRQGWKRLRLGFDFGTAGGYKEIISHNIWGYAHVNDEI
jgi:hypothetical protein